LRFLYLARAILIPLAFAIILTLVLSLRWAGYKSWVWAAFHRTAHHGGLHRGAGGVGWVIFNELVEVINDLPSLPGEHS